MTSLPYWKGKAHELLQVLDTQGGFLVVPSAPSLCQAARDAVLWNAHLHADHAVLDSGYLSILLRLSGRCDIPRISGHQLLEGVLSSHRSGSVPFASRKILWVVPSSEERSRISALLQRSGFLAEHQTYYVAPSYESDADFRDERLVEMAREWQPDWIILCIGGGRQEKLGSYLRTTLGRRPAIMATGAAVSFFSGGQAPIPRLADRLYLGWLVRILSSPRQFFMRYLRALALPLALWRLRGDTAAARVRTPAA